MCKFTRLSNSCFAIQLAHNNDIFDFYNYNSDGDLISKASYTEAFCLIYAGDILAGQKTGDNVLMWIYDNNGAYIGFTYNGAEYYYVYNLQGDVEAITDASR